MPIRILCILLIFTLTAIYAQNSRISGKVAGRVFDKESGQPVESANVYLEGFTYGSSTDAEGFFTILNIPAGKYTMVVSFIGYKQHRIQNIHIVPEVTSTHEIFLENELVQGEVVVVTAEKPMVRKEITSTIKEISALEIQRSPVSNFTQIIAQQIGTVQTGRELRSGGLHIRGGRNNEIAYYLDGVLANDPFSGLTGVDIDNNSIEQINIISSGFSAEFGESMSGIVHIITKQPEFNAYNFVLESSSDFLFSGNRYDWGYNKYFASLTGPLPGLNALKGSFYSTITLLNQDDRQPAIIKQDYNDLKSISGMLKFSLVPLNNMRLQLMAQVNTTEEHLYSHSRSAYSYWLNQGMKRNTPDNRVSLSLTHTLSPQTWYDLILVRFENSVRYSSQNGKSYKDWRTLNRNKAWVDEAYNNGWYDPISNTFTDVSEEEAFYYYYHQNGNVTKNQEDDWVWNSPEEQQAAYNDRYYDTGYWSIENGTLQYNEFSIKNYSKYLDDKDNPLLDKYRYRGDIDLFYGAATDPLGNYNLDFIPWWHDHTNSYIQGDLTFSSQLNKKNFLKTGGKLKIYDLKYRDIQFLNSNPYFDSYEVSPIEAALFIQNKFEHEDLIIDAGLRFDYWDPDHEHISDLEDLDSPYEKTIPKWDLSPRVGISFAASEDMYIFMNYGQFFQKADLGDLYQNLNADVTNGLPLIGNPDLPAQKTTAYEMGFQNLLNKNVSMKLSGFYKDAHKLLSTDKVNSVLDGRPASYTIYLVNDFAKIKGFEIELEKRYTGGISGRLTYSFLDAKGTGSSAADFYYDYLLSDTEFPRKEYPLDFDITHMIKTNLNYYIPQNDGIELWDFKPFSNTNFNFYTYWNSGAAYTPQDSRGNPQERGSGRMPSQFNTDMRIDKYFDFGIPGLEFDFFIDIRNVFDNRNVLQIYNFTGKADDNGRPPIYDPANLGIYANYGFYGYESAQDMFNAGLAGWKKRVKNPAHYTNPRIIRSGIRITF
jgi:outer membrane receptor protein involved in Fe transport